jgi:hypothetical protein
MSRKYSTSTITSDGRLVPWLVAEGPLAYTPENPPSRDYYFQYGWVLPKVICSKNKRHYYFGACLKSEAEDVFKFRNAARAGRVDHVLTRFGTNAESNIAAPIAVYRHPIGWDKKPGYIFIQHGSYQVIEQQAQPLIDKGFVVLSRGIGTATEFKRLQFRFSRLTAGQSRAWRLYCKTQWRILSDSALSFMAVHDSVVRYETSHLHGRTFISEKVAGECGLDLAEGGIGNAIWENSLQGFSMQKWVAERKFGPNYAAFKTPLDNIRLTAFFADESEVRVVDPTKLELLETYGCKDCVVPLLKD